MSDTTDLDWIKDGDKNCGYNNWLAITPFGRILITWKGWKDGDQSTSVDEFPGELPAFYGSPNVVRDLAEAEYWRRVRLASAMKGQTP